jgi:hypothetical protein
MLQYHYIYLLFSKNTLLRQRKSHAETSKTFMRHNRNICIYVIPVHVFTFAAAGHCAAVGAPQLPRCRAAAGVQPRIRPRLQGRVPLAGAVVALQYIYLEVYEVQVFSGQGH